ncbi:LysR family transcriptional regulator [Limoniibacter endophyticus]|uniref:Transcriptional regulator n=1 Tax=Limoniibacter endophyticus TaxID=1565040 RepID=A0A8J3DUJ1_9HYPH|nr:LysR family transcriptional regulator [Limoniibacter endophyticus]GHC78375.1 transcriptional regulator [Limoniibacter endophyticus]
MHIGRNLIPDIWILQAFVSAAHHSSFTMAAAELNLTQSAVSRQIRALEEQLGVALFERVRKKVVLSTAGRALLPDAIRLLNQTEELVLRAKTSSDGRRTLSIATLPTFGSRWLIPRLPDFFRLNPECGVKLSSRSEPFDLVADEFDLAIHYGQPYWPRAVCTYLCSEIVVPVASPDLLSSRPVTATSNLENAPLLHLMTRPKLWSEWMQTYQCDASNAFSGNTFDQFNMLIEAAVAGLGFALLPKYLIETELRESALQIVLDHSIETDNHYYLVVPESKAQDLATKRFLDWMISMVPSRW